MLSKPYRLQYSADIQRIRQSGRRWRHPLAILLVDDGTHDVSRFAFVASRWVGNAVKRNRAKRLLREAVRLRLPVVCAGKDCVLIARKRIVSASFADVDTAVAQLFAQAGLVE